MTIRPQERHKAQPVQQPVQDQAVEKKNRPRAVVPKQWLEAGSTRFQKLEKYIERPIATIPQASIAQNPDLADYDEYRIKGGGSCWARALHRCVLEQVLNDGVKYKDYRDKVVVLGQQDATNPLNMDEKSKSIPVEKYLNLIEHLRQLPKDQRIRSLNEDSGVDALSIQFVRKTVAGLMRVQAGKNKTAIKQINRIENNNTYGSALEIMPFVSYFGVTVHEILKDGGGHNIYRPSPTEAPNHSLMLPVESDTMVVLYGSKLHYNILKRRQIDVFFTEEPTQPKPISDYETPPSKELPGRFEITLERALDEAREIDSLETYFPGKNGHLIKTDSWWGYVMRVKYFFNPKSGSAANKKLSEKALSLLNSQVTRMLRDDEDLVKSNDLYFLSKLAQSSPEGKHKVAALMRSANAFIAEKQKKRGTVK